MIVEIPQEERTVCVMDLRKWEFDALAYKPEVLVPMATRLLLDVLPQDIAVSQAVVVRVCLCL